MRRRPASSAMALCAAVLLGVAAGCGERDDARPAPPPTPPERVPPPPEGPLGLVPAFPQLPSFRFLTALAQAPGDPGRWYVLEQEGRLRWFENAPSASRAPLILDLGERVAGPDVNWEAGLVRLAFHPRFQSNRFFYLFFTEHSDTSEVGSRWVLSRFRLPEGGGPVDPASERRLLSRDCGHVSYNGGSLVFDSRGRLFVTTGQNVPSDTRPHPSQDLERLEGKVLRLDVDGGEPYAIPDDKPFAAGGGAPEIWAWGFRNPWRLAIDRESGRVFVGDVGEHSWEEIDLVEPGRNYGWPLVEGDTCDDECPERYQAPIHAYAGPNSAVVGGAVYRGRAIPELRGEYLFADFMRAEVWGLRPQGDTWRARRLMRTGGALRDDELIGSLTSFAEDAEGELYAVTRGGRIPRFVPVDEMSRYYLGLGGR